MCAKDGVCERWCVRKTVCERKSAAASRATKRPQARHQTQPSPISATPATQNEGRCDQVPRLPRKVRVDVTNCHACHAKVPRRHARPRGPQARHQTQPSPISATPATQNEGQCHQAPRLPRKVRVDVRDGV